jgi:multisubunit Na+/H+ antiporter MnhG subunit
VTVRHVFSDIFLGLAVVVVLISAVGVLVMRDGYQKLHYVSPAALVAPVLVSIAVWVYAGFSATTTETLLALLFMVISGPLISHATVRAIRIRETGDWRPWRRGQSAPGGERAGHQGAGQL